MHFNVCQVPARNYKKDGTNNGSPQLWLSFFLIQQYSVKF